MRLSACCEATTSTLLETPATIRPPFFSWKHFAGTAAVSIGYLLLARLLIGFKSEQLFLVVLFNAMYYASRPTRKIILGFSVFIIFWIIFDSMKAFPNYRYNNVHIASLYGAEKALFGFTSTGARITPNEFFAAHHAPFFDVLAGCFYLCWVPVPLLFAGYLFYKNRTEFLAFSLTFLLVNLIGFVVYYAYPAAPPWYVQQYGFTFHAATPGNTAGLGRFDAAVGAGVFKSIYGKSSNVFAAMPSLHASYPLIVFFYGLRNRLGAINILFGIIMAGIWWAAVYSSHHYVLDVLAGITCGLTGITLFRLFVRSRRGAACFHYLLRPIR